MSGGGADKSRGKGNGIGNGSRKSSRNFFEHHVDGRGPLYALAFNFRDVRFTSLLATAGKHGATVFCLEDVQVTVPRELLKPVMGEERKDTRLYERGKEDETDVKTKIDNATRKNVRRRREWETQIDKRTLVEKSLVMNDLIGRDRDAYHQGRKGKEIRTKEELDNDGEDDDTDTEGHSEGDREKRVEGAVEDQDKYDNTDNDDDDDDDDDEDCKDSEEFRGQEDHVCWLPSERLKVLMTYRDENKDEDFYCCTWASGRLYGNGYTSTSCNDNAGAHEPKNRENNGNRENGSKSNGSLTNDRPFLVLGGYCGIVKVLDISTGTLVHAFKGHGNCINSLTVFPRQPRSVTTDGSVMGNGNGNGNENHNLTENNVNDQVYEEGDLILSASKDESIRIWNLKSKTCVLVLAGAGGHTGEITTLVRMGEDPSFNYVLRFPIL